MSKTSKRNKFGILYNVKNKEYCEKCKWISTLALKIRCNKKIP
jgi:hypothetical protein